MAVTEMTFQAVAETGLSPKSMTDLGLIHSVFTDGQGGGVGVGNQDHRMAQAAHAQAPAVVECGGSRELLSWPQQRELILASPERDSGLDLFF